MKIVISFLCFLSVTATAQQRCSFSLIKNEVAKFHGPEWSQLSNNCTNSEIRRYLKNIILSPDDALSDFADEQKKFLYRNSIKSYGHFSNQIKDLVILNQIYNDKNENVKKLFGKEFNIFRITILESMANTGNIESLNFFYKIMEDENNVLFLQQYASDFAGWVINGTPLSTDSFLQGTRQYGEYFFPNLSEPAHVRLRDDAYLLEKLSDKKNLLKNLVQDMLLRKDRFAPIEKSLITLNAILENTNANDILPENNETLNDHDASDAESMNGGKTRHSSFDQPKTKIQRRPSSTNEKPENTSSNYRLISFLIGCLILFYFVIRSRIKKK